MSDSRLFVIDAEKEKVHAQDFAFLRQQGLELIQVLCSDTWTDHNLHDPGITILEQLCFALTDLAYRTDFPIADILSDEAGNIQPDDNCFFGREAILPANPVTVNDFRKVLIDEMEELHNVWLEPAVCSYAHDGISGLYRLTIQVKKEMVDRLMTEPAFENALRKKALQTFVAKRNIGEDIVQEVKVLKPVAIRVRADVIIGDGIKPEMVLALIYQALEEAINPPVQYFTEEEMLAKGCKTEEIYTGPLLRNGFIPDAELRPRSREIDPAELIKAVTQIDGVIYVKNLAVVGLDKTTSKLPYSLNEPTFAWFDDDPGASPVHVYKDKYRVHIQESVFRDIRLQVQEAAKRRFVPALKRLPDTGVLQGKYRNLSDYYSLQHFFPVIYGIGQDGLSAQATPARKAQAKQLKAYLLFFEQVLAGYLSQLANTRTLFSPYLDHHAAQTYFYQPLYQVPGVSALLKAFTEKYGADEWNRFTAEPNAYTQALGKTAESDETFRMRKNRLFDHLLSRFNEQVIHYPVTLYQLLYAATPEARVDTLLQWKAGLLRNIVTLSSNRVRSFDYLQPGDNNGSGFGKKIAALLYIPNYPAPSLTAVFKPQEMQLVQAPAGASKVDSASKTAADIAFKKDGRIVAGTADMQQLKTDGLLRPEQEDKGTGAYHFGRQNMSFFKHGLDAANYMIGPDTDKGAGYLLLYKEPSVRTWSVIGRYKDEATAIKALQQLMAYLKNISRESEGFYIVEHVLLRPLLHTLSFGFRFYGPENQVVLQHDRWMNFEERNQVIGGIIQVANENTGQSSIKALANLCRVMLRKDQSTGLFVNPAWMSDIETAEAAGDFEAICHYMQLFTHKKYRYLPRFELLMKDAQGNIMAESFFNFTITILLPAWPARFQDDNFRLLLEDLFRVNAPAHIKIQFQWLNISRMTRFEQLQADWLTALRDQDDLSGREKYGQQMMAFLKE
jgi:hypothetical protein